MGGQAGDQPRRLRTSLLRDCSVLSGQVEHGARVARKTARSRVPGRGPHPRPHVRQGPGSQAGAQAAQRAADGEDTLWRTLFGKEADKLEHANDDERTYYII